MPPRIKWDETQIRYFSRGCRIVFPRRVRAGGTDRQTGRKKDGQTEQVLLY